MMGGRGSLLHSKAIGGVFGQLPVVHWLAVRAPPPKARDKEGRTSDFTYFLESLFKSREEVYLYILNYVMHTTYFC